MVQSAATVADIVSMNPKCQINGVIAIYDLSGITAKHATELLWNGRLWACLSFAQVYIQLFYFTVLLSIFFLTVEVIAH